MRVIIGWVGALTGMVPDHDVAWHAGKLVREHARGRCRAGGFAVQGATRFTERLYQTTAKLVRYLAALPHSG